MFSDTLLAQAEALLQACRAASAKVATAESCTGGLIVGCLTEIAGSSDVVDRGFITYSNDAKHAMLGVPMALIETHGAVSEPVARAMAEGAIARSLADLAVAVTGVAGPGGGSVDKPVGLVHLACARRGGTTVHQKAQFDDLGRTSIRQATIQNALNMLSRALGS